VTRKNVNAQAAHLWSVASLFLAPAGNPGGAHLLAVAQKQLKKFGSYAGEADYGHGVQ